jgi:hypothetical protein
MPRASWKGFLRLSLVSCPVYLSPAPRTKAPPQREQDSPQRRLVDTMMPLSGERANGARTYRG